MRLSLACSVLPIVASVGAIIVTEPKKFAEIDPSGSLEVKWTHVDTDASHCDIYLVNNAVYPPVQKKLASDIDTSDGSYTAEGISGLTNGGGYQINLMSNEGHNTGILAQSQQFNVTGGSSSSSSTMSSTSTETSTTISTSTSTGKSTTKTATTSTSSGTSSAQTSASAGTHAKTTGSSHTTSASDASISGTDAADADNGAGALGSPMLTVAGVMAGVLAWAM